MDLAESLRALREESGARAAQTAALTPLPDIDLYMDQVITLTEQRLACFRRNNSEKLLTKAMINNYTKDTLLPPPTRKKYGKAHLAGIFAVYFLKQTLSIPDVQAVMQRGGLIDEGDLAAMSHQLEEALGTVDMAVADIAPEPDAVLGAIIHLSLEAYARKRMAEKLIDALRAQKAPGDKQTTEKQPGAQ